MSSEYPKWASGPAEILRHGLRLLTIDRDVNRRLAMISIDNSVELMIKTYLGLPKRVTGLTIARKSFQEISESFPALLNALEEFAPAMLGGLDLGQIEWYHRLRNQLYHQGNGLTVELDNVVTYAEIANSLFENLFGRKLVNSVCAGDSYGVDFLNDWACLESELERLAISVAGQRPNNLAETVKILRSADLLSSQQENVLYQLEEVKHAVILARHPPQRPPLSLAESRLRLRDFRGKLPKVREPH